MLTTTEGGKLGFYLEKTFTLISCSYSSGRAEYHHYPIPKKRTRDVAGQICRGFSV
jgi:hypothetical protein